MEKRIAISFMELTRKKNYSKISIAEIMKPLNVSRQNFYYYFENVDDLIDRINTSFLSEPFLNFRNDRNLKNSYVSTLIYIRDYSDLLKNMLSYMGNGPFEKSMYDNLMNAIIEHIGTGRLTTDIRFSADLYVRGVISIFTDLIKNGFDRTPDELADLFIQALPQNMMKFYTFDKYDKDVSYHKLFR